MSLELGDHTLSLASGRSLGYAVYGDPSGHVILNCHGGLVSGHDASPAHEHARSLGLCIISPDRPGSNRTDRLPGHSMTSWVRADVIPLLEHLGIEDLAVMGWSEGGQYALAVSFELGARITRCAVIAGCLPLDDDATFHELNRLDRTLTMLANRAPFLLRSYFTITARLASTAPKVLTRMATAGLPAAETEAIHRQGPWLPTILGEGARQPQGGVDEYLTMTAPWGFSPEEITVPVRIFQGDADSLVPPSWAKTLADRIPSADLTLYPGEGHFIALTRSDDVLEYLADGFGAVRSD